MAGIGFKIADGYVEVHARYDKGELQKAAQQAADDHDKEFNKERVRNSRGSDSRNTNRKVGGQAGTDFIKGMREQVDRDKDKPIISVDRVKKDASMLARVHVEAFEREAVNKQAPRWRRIGTQISRRIGAGLTSRDGAGSAAGAFVTRFVESVTLGMADLKSSTIAGPIGRSFAAAGTTVGLAFAAAFVVHAGSAIAALTPLLLAAIGGLGVFAQIKMWGVKKEDGKWVINMATRMGRAIKGLKNEFKDFVQFATDPLFEPIIKSLKIITDKLNSLRGPVARFFREFGKALPDLTAGVMDMIIEFFRALDPILKSGAFREGLKEWARQFPRIGKALGDFFTAVLKDPDKVIDTIKRLGDDLIVLSEAAADIVTNLSDAARAYDEFAAAIDKFENSTGPGAGGVPGGGPLGGIVANLKRLPGEFMRAFDRFRAFIEPKLEALGRWIADKFWRALDKLKDLGSRLKAWIGQGITAAIASLKQRLGEAKTAISTKAREIVDAIVKWLKSLPGKGHAAIVTFPAKLMTVFNEAAAKATQKAKELVTKAVAKLKELPGKAKAALSTLASKVATEVTQAKDKAVAKAKELVDRVVTFLKTLPGKAKSAVSSLASKVGTEFSQAVTKGKQKAKELVDGFIKKLNELPGKAKSAAGKVKGAVQSALSGAGSWLVGAGKALMTGLANGIRAGLTWVKNAAITAAKAAVGAAKRALGIKSPSTVAAEQIGKPLAEGIGVGMRRHVSEEFKELPGMLPKPAGGKGGAGNTYHSTSSWNPTINVHVAAGLDPVNAAARRALTKDIFLALEQYRKDYVDR